MILENKPYLIHGALFFIFFSFIVFSNEIKATKFVKKHWFYKRSLKSKLSSVFYILGFLFLLVSLLDIKGNEKKTLTYLPEQKVIVLIDCSLSMRSTDVFPSRFERSINFIRQFMRKGIGSKFSLMAFSDRSEVLIPFTDDLSIIESRLDLLQTMKITNGGSNLNQSLSEAMTYLDVNSHHTETVGSILLVTDGDLHDKEFKLSIKKNINIGILNISSTKGSKVPHFDKSGNYLYPKLYNGKTVISSIHQSYFSNLQNNNINVKFWNWSKGSMPLDEIVNYYEKYYMNELRKGTKNVREVLGHRFSSIGILLLILGYFLSFFKSFHKGLAFYVLILSFFDTRPLYAKKMEESLVEKIKIGNSNREEKLKLAEIFLKKNKLKLSKNLFEENLYKSLLDNEINTIFNYGTLLLKMGNIEKGIGILERLKYSRKLMNAPTRDLDEKINSNILYSIKIRKERRIDKKNENKKHERNKEKKIVASKKRSIRKYELLLKLKNKILKIKKNREKREYGGVISHLVNEDENLQKKIIKINIYSTQREKFKKDW